MNITGIKLYTIKSGDAGARGAAMAGEGWKRELLAPFKG
jgi:hypothetical protein